MGDGASVGNVLRVGAIDGAPYTSPCDVWNSSAIGAQPLNESPCVSSNWKQASEWAPWVPSSTIVWMLSARQK